MSETKTKITLEDFAKVVLGCIQEINGRLTKLEALVPKNLVVDLTTDDGKDIG